MKKLLLVLAAVAAVALFFALGLDSYLSFEHLKASRREFQDLYVTHGALLVGAYFGLYVLVAALSLPGAVAMTLVGGALFGFWTSLVVVSFASSIGATLACFASRYVLRDWVRARFGGRLSRVDEGFRREGAYYLFTLRLIPVFPFFLVNLLMGLTPMPLRTFYWVSQLGMLPGTMVFVNAGSQLGRIESPSSILSPGLLVSLALLGVFPLAVKKVMEAVKARRAKAR